MNVYDLVLLRLVKEAARQQAKERYFELFGQRFPWEEKDPLAGIIGAMKREAREGERAFGRGLLWGWETFFRPLWETGYGMIKYHPLLTATALPLGIGLAGAARRAIAARVAEEGWGPFLRTITEATGKAARVGGAALTGLGRRAFKAWQRVPGVIRYPLATWFLYRAFKSLTE